MAIFISDDKISEIRNTTDIVDIISDVVSLKKAGKNYIGLCPFHTEKTPSFNVSPDKQIFHCFGCGIGGDVFSFLMKHDGLSFPEAVRIVATRYGIEIPTQRLSPGQKRKINERENLLNVNRQAMNYFRHSLLERASGKKAMEYLNKRGITKDTIESFVLGYVPEGWDNLTNFLIKKKMSSTFLEKSGLIISRKSSSGHYDRFRNRIIFPIFNVSRQVIGFGGRVMDDSDPKYLNSPETPVYNKSRSLYGLNMAKDKCRESKTVFIVEGYFDLLALHQHGIINSVATLGTSLTMDHVRILRGYIGKTGRVVLVYDSDDAGLKAAYRSIEIFDKGYVDARILVLPTGYDPDSYIFKFGKKSFMDAFSRAPGIIPFLIDFAEKKHGDSIEGKIRIISELKGPLAAIKDNVARSLYVKELSERLGIDETAILEKVRDISAKNKAKESKIGLKPIYPSNLQKKGKKSEYYGRTSNESKNRIERQIIAMMLQFPKILHEIKERDVLDCFVDSNLKSIGQSILDYKEKLYNHDRAPGDEHEFANGNRVSEFMNFIDDQEKKSIITSLALEEESWELEGCIKLITQFVETSRNRRSKGFIEKQIKEAEEKNDQELLIKLLIEKQNMAVLKQKQKMALLNRSIREA